MESLFCLSPQDLQDVHPSKFPMTFCGVGMDIFWNCITISAIKIQENLLIKYFHTNSNGFIPIIQTCSSLSCFETDRYPSNLWQVWVCTLNVSLVFECKYSTDGWMTYLRCWESLLSIGSSEKIWFFKAIPGKMESQFTSKHSSTPGYLHYYCSNYAFCISCNNYTKVYVPLGYSSSLSKALEIITRQALIKENQNFVKN